MRLFIILMMLVSCNAKNESKTQDINQKIVNLLNDWNLSADVESKIEGGEIYILIFYKKKSSIPSTKKSYYLDKNSNDLIVQFLLYNFQKELRLFKNINLILKFEGAADVAKFTFNNMDIEAIKKTFSNNIFYDNLDYSLRNFDYDDILLFNLIIKNTINDVKTIDFPVKFDFPILNFWKMLKIYSDFCKYPNLEELEKFELFLLLIHSLNNNFKKYANYGIEKRINKFLDNCNISSAITRMNFKEMDLYIRKHFHLE